MGPVARCERPGGMRGTIRSNAAWRRSGINQDIYAIPHLVMDKVVALLLAIHAYDERSTRGHERNIFERAQIQASNKRDPRALQEALTASTMEPHRSPDHYII